MSAVVQAHRLSFAAWEDVQDGVLSSAALLEHHHATLLLIKLKGRVKKEQRKQLRLLIIFR